MAADRTREAILRAIEARQGLGQRAVGDPDRLVSALVQDDDTRSSVAGNVAETTAAEIADRTGIALADSVVDGMTARLSNDAKTLIAAVNIAPGSPNLS